MSAENLDPRPGRSGGDPEPFNLGPPQPDKGYALSGKIMLSAIVVLFFVVILMVCLHLYARWYLLRARRHLRRNRHNRRTHIVFHDDNSAPAVSAGARGLDVSILNSLPVFVFDSKSKSKSKSQSTYMSAVADNNLEEEHPMLECAVCLSEFEDNETGRLLPKCNHSFHIECIDMWFQSHSTCPLCRAPVESGPGSETRPDVVITVSDSVPGEPGPSSDSVDGPRRTASFGGRVKPLGIVVPPRRNESFEDSGCGESPASQAFRSPMSRMLSFRRIMSRDKRNGGVSPSAGCSSVAESDIELGGGRQESELTRREEKQG